jgi:hypothetical protein
LRRWITVSPFSSANTERTVFGSVFGFMIIEVIWESRVRRTRRSDRTPSECHGLG